VCCKNKNYFDTAAGAAAAVGSRQRASGSGEAGVFLDYQSCRNKKYFDAAVAVAAAAAAAAVFLVLSSDRDKV
jgi:hypothetical protein